MTLKDIKNMLMLHKLSLNMILRIATMTDLNAHNKTLILNLRQTNPNPIATTNQQHHSNLLIIRINRFWFETNRFSSVNGCLPYDQILFVKTLGDFY
jgi:hypothetical protein